MRLTLLQVVLPEFRALQLRKQIESSIQDQAIAYTHAFYHDHSLQILPKIIKLLKSIKVIYLKF